MANVDSFETKNGALTLFDKDGKYMGTIVGVSELMFDTAWYAQDWVITVRGTYENWVCILLHATQIEFNGEEEAREYNASLSL